MQKDTNSSIGLHKRPNHPYNNRVAHRVYKNNRHILYDAVAAKYPNMTSIGNNEEEQIMSGHDGGGGNLSNPIL